jgi:protein-L-isoaspartate(D-aspartate) O-methyltransferase
LITVRREGGDMELAVLRDDMVEGLSHPSKGVLSSEALTVALRTVPRHEFVPAEPEAAYADKAFDHRGSTGLAPSTVAILLEALELREGQDVLVVGAGVGYTAALLAELVGETRVHAIDIDRQLVYVARSNLESAGYPGVLVDVRDGADGLPEYAPFDRILVEAAAVAPPERLVDQLAHDGRLVIPLGGPDQSLSVVDATGEVLDRAGPVAFDPLLVDGEQGSAPVRNRTVREDRERSESQGYFAKTGWEQEWIDWDDRL